MKPIKKCCNHDCNQSDDCPLRALKQVQQTKQTKATPLNTANSDGSSPHQRIELDFHRPFDWIDRVALHWVQAVLLAYFFIALGVYFFWR